MQEDQDLLHDHVNIDTSPEIPTSRNPPSVGSRALIYAGARFRDFDIYQKALDNALKAFIDILEAQQQTLSIRLINNESNCKAMIHNSTEKVKEFSKGVEYLQWKLKTLNYMIEDVDMLREFNNIQIPLKSNARNYYEMLIRLRSQFKIHGVDGQERSKKITFFDYMNKLSVSAESGNASDALKYLKGRVITQSKGLSHFIIDLGIFISKRGLGMKLFKVLERSLKWVCNGESSLFINKFLEVVQIVDTKLSKNMNKRKADMMVGSGDDKRMNDDYVGELTFLLIKEIFRLKLFGINRRLPCFVISNALLAFRLVEADLNKSEEVVEKLKSRIRSQFLQIRMLTGEIYPTIKGNDEIKEIESKIYTLWDKFAEFEKLE